MVLTSLATNSPAPNPAGGEMPEPSMDGKGKKPTSKSCEREIRDRADGVQGLAPKAQSDDAGEVVCRPDLACRVLGDGASRILGRHPRSVVADPDQGHPAVFDLDLHSARPRVEGVLDQLLDCGRRTLDDLPGGDPVRHLRRQ